MDELPDFTWRDLLTGIVLGAVVALIAFGVSYWVVAL